MATKTSNIELKIELRYCFIDKNKHTMNAEVFNECERQFIKALRSTEKYFEETLLIKIKPREKGSITDVLTVAFNNPVFVSLLSIFATKFFDATFSTAKHKTDETSKKLENLQKVKEQIKAAILTEDDFDYIASNDKDLRKQKSNFFKSAKKEAEIAKIETTTIINSNIQPIIIIVERKDFESFIIPETTEQTEETEEGKIYIVAPVLIKGRRDAWKGIYHEISIDFKISDKEFLEQVWNKQVNFQNGTYINCKLKIVTTTNIETEETKISREVITVINYGEDDQTVKTISHRRKSKTIDTSHQLTMFTENSLLPE